jgi:hypothetical protein
MARRRVKKRTHVGANNGTNVPNAKSIERAPKSMVIRIGAGEVGPSISQLVKDVRSVMEPGTAARLKVLPSHRFTLRAILIIPTGAQIKQTARLHDYGRTARRYTFDAFLQVRIWKYKYETCHHSKRPYITFSC